MPRHALLAFAGLMLSVAVACSPKNPNPPAADAGSEVTEVDAGNPVVERDGGMVDAGFFCTSDLQCEQFKKGLRCDTIDGRCVPAAPCAEDSNCQRSDPDDYCFEGGTQCRCVTTDSRPDSGFPGVCHRRKKVCEECTGDPECGSTSVFEPEGACKALPMDTSGKKYCLRRKIGSVCLDGTVDDGTGFCRPQTNSCMAFGCNEDKDCDPGSSCNTRTRVCERRCRWDFTAKESLPGCGYENGQAKVCWVDSDSLNPALPTYGSGRCRLPCTEDSECHKSALNPQGGPNLKCAGEKLSNGGVSAKRCRANGECMDRLECPFNSNGKPELGYCDLAKFSCQPDCRLGKDPVTQAPYPDCQSGYQCVAGGTQGALNSCRQQPCAEGGGALRACARGQLCCGEDRNGDGIAEPCPPGVTLEGNNCYDPPAPPYCTECATNADCAGHAGLAPKDGGTPLPSLCVVTAMRGNEPLRVCQLSTLNDFTLLSDGQTAARHGCPAQYTVELPRVTTDGADGEDACTEDLDCVRGHDAGVGKCGADPRRQSADGGMVKSCLCDNSTKAWVCPKVGGENFFSFCPALPGVQACTQSVVCAPTAGQLFPPRGPPTYGCGLPQ